MLLKNKFLPYIAFFGFYLLGLSGIKNLGEYITLVIFLTILSAVSYTLAVKKYKPIIALPLSFMGLYLGLLMYFYIFKFLLKPFIGKKGSQEQSTKKSVLPKSGYTMSNESDIERLKFEIDMYEKDYEKGMRSPSRADNEHAIKIHLPMIEQRKKQLKDLEEDLKRNQTADDFRNKR
jgi:hypothetical protein